MEISWELIIGPAGLTVFAVYVAKILWDSHKKSDDQLVARLEKSEARTDVALDGWRAQTDASGRAAAAIEKIEEDRLQRRRHSDGS